MTTHNGVNLISYTCVNKVPLIVSISVGLWNRSGFHHLHRGN